MHAEIDRGVSGRKDLVEFLAATSADRLLLGHPEAHHLVRVGMIRGPFPNQRLSKESSTECTFSHFRFRSNGNSRRIQKLAVLRSGSRY
jgi:hypothetical protein